MQPVTFEECNFTLVKQISGIVTVSVLVYFLVMTDEQPYYFFKYLYNFDFMIMYTNIVKT